MSELVNRAKRLAAMDKPSEEWMGAEDEREYHVAVTAHIEALEAIVEKLPMRMASMLFAGHNIYTVDQITGRDKHLLSHRELNQLLRRLSTRAAAEAAAKEGAGT